MPSSSLKPEFVIELKNVCKKYKLFRAPLHRLKEAFGFAPKESHQDFTALQNISFKLKKGKTLGIIGRNGSGKSTLLQLIVGIIKPNSGQVLTQGKITCLLELGAGFNPDFTGRENVFLSGMLAGLSKKEVLSRLGEIESFADIGEYFDQPVRSYSSGMFVRLAFSTSIHSEPDILIIDEALAVGDAQFQQKCYEKLKDFQRQNKTIIFVTHDMNAIVRHSDLALLLDKGEIKKIGSPSEVVSAYHEIITTGSLEDRSSIDSPKKIIPLESGSQNLEKFIDDIADFDQCAQRNGYNKNEHRYGSKKAEIIDFLTINNSKSYSKNFSSESLLDIYLKVRFHEPMMTPLVGFSIKTLEGIVIHGANSWLAGTPFRSTQKNQVRVFRFSVKLDLNYGDYMLEVGVAERIDNRDEIADARSNFIHFYVTENKRFEGLVYLDTRFEEVPVLQESKR